MYQQNENNNKKPPAFPLEEPVVNQIPYNWNVDEMPWKRNNNHQQSIMLFDGVNSNLGNGKMIPPSPAPIPSTSGINLLANQVPRIKRKIEIENYYPNKQLITEEKMADYLNNIHLSDNFQAHNINLSDNTFDDGMNGYTVNLSPLELEQRLKRAQRIEILSEDVKKSLFENNRNELYKVLSNRIEKPCQALVLWQPPQALERIILDFSNCDKKNNESENEEKMIE